METVRDEEPKIMRAVTLRGPGSWTDEELRRVGDAVELELAPRRPDGQLRPYTSAYPVTLRLLRSEP